MAIILEEERNRLSLLSLLSWVVVLIIIVVAVYYLFIKDPGRVDVVLPGFSSTEKITGISIDPKNFIKNPNIIERIPPSPVSEGVAGRDNPFIPY